MSRSKHDASGGSFQVTSIYFTVNNWTEDDWTKVRASPLYSYGIMGKEVGELGTPHLQGFVQLKKRKRSKGAFNQLAAYFHARPHMGKPDGTAQQNQAYCSKDKEFVEWGTIKVHGGKRARMDLEAMKLAIQAGASWEELALEHTAAHARYHKWGERLRTEIRTRLAKEELKAEMMKIKLRTWQENCLRKLAAQSPRQVLWVLDSTGEKGKTFLAKWLCVMQDAFYIEGGKKADISYAYDFQRTVVFDLCRSTEEFVNYGTIESFKNGMMFSPKYESAVKVFKAAQVIVFSNWAPDQSKLSADRWDIVDLETDAWIDVKRHLTGEFIFTDPEPLI